MVLPRKSAFDGQDELQKNERNARIALPIPREPAMQRLVKGESKMEK